MESRKKIAIVALLVSGLAAWGCTSDPITVTRFTCDPDGPNTCDTGHVCVRSEAGQGLKGVCTPEGTLPDPDGEDAATADEATVDAPGESIGDEAGDQGSEAAPDPDAEAPQADAAAETPTDAAGEAAEALDTETADDTGGETPVADVAAERSLKVEGLPASAPAGAPVTVTVLARDPAGKPAPGASIAASVTRGGGHLDAAVATTDAGGHATFSFTLGPAPVLQRVSLDWDGVTTNASLDATIASPQAPGPFGDINGYLSDRKIEGSTEDLAFTPDGRHLVLGVPGALIQVEPSGDASTLSLTGDALGWVLGLAYDSNGVLWGADANGKALRRIDPSGNVTTIAGGPTATPLKYPNDVAIAPGGRIVLADSCLGQVLVFSPDGQVLGRAQFDARTEGGPNGVAIDPAGNALWVTTENTQFLCLDDSDFNTANGGLYRFDLGTDGTLGPRTDVAPGFGHYADGVTFDAEGNLYVLVDRMNTQELGLADSTLWVLPAEGGDLRAFLTTTDRIMANAAFGTTPFDQDSLYLSLIAMPLVVEPEQRGVLRTSVGIRGLPLVPSP